MNPPIIELPFDEPTFATVAQDFSGNGNNAYLLSKDFISQGRQGNSLFTFPFGVTQVNENPIVYTADFTVYFWMVTGYNSQFPHTIYCYVMLSGTTQVLQLNPGTSAESWTHLTLTKSGNRLSLYSGGVLMDYYDVLPANSPVIGFIFNKQYVTGTPSDIDVAPIQIDGFAAVNGYAYTLSDIQSEIEKGTSKLSYFINGVDFKQLGINVDGEVKGLIGRPALKDVKQYDWRDRHGSAVDLDHNRYEDREIEMDCWFRANSRDQIVDMASAIKDAFSASGLQRFMFQAAARTIVYNVYLPEDIDFKVPKWVDRKTITRFSLRMIEPEPVKRVLKFVHLPGGEDTATITFNTNKELFNIYWGDGGVTANVYSETGTTTNVHVFQNPGEYYITVSGVVEKITQFTSNCILVWNKSY